MFIIAQITVPIVDSAIVVDAANPEVRTIVGVERVVSVERSVVVVTGIDVALEIAGPIVVAEVVMVVSRPDEQVQRDGDVANDAARRIVVAGSAVDPAAKVDRREQPTSQPDSIVPVAADVEAPARRPDVASRNPHPVLLVGIPVSGSPSIDVAAVDPAAGNPEVRG